MTKPSNNPMSAAQRNRELLQNQRKEYQERNRRSHRLIVKGAIIENLFPKTVTMSADEFKEYLLENMASDSELSDDFSW
ncbi:MAG: DUF3847 domain-containing protein [Clostridia bacterium]|nr:DUF3847 domain-containing protein [Clostridia bacterium]